MLRPPDSAVWTGRLTDESEAYWYQLVRCRENLPSSAELAIIGYAVDEGVRRNQGRTGAQGGPQAIRARLAREPWHGPSDTELVDAGTVHCEDGNLEAAQVRLSQLVSACRGIGAKTLVLGGGHDVAYAHGAGLLQHLLSQNPSARLGIINFDAHLDMRPLENGRATSGTPFAQLAEEAAAADRPFNYLCVGLQRQGNTKGLLDRAATAGAQWLSLDALRESPESLEKNLDAFMEDTDALYVTVDLDGFPGYVSPGVSAPGVDGLSFTEVMGGLRQLVSSGKVVGLDLAECNPMYDIDDRTARLAARIISVICPLWIKA